MRASPLCRPMYLLPLLLGMLFHELTEQALQWMEKYGDGNAQIDISFHLIIKILFYFLQNCNLLNVNTNRLPKYIFLMCLFWDKSFPCSSVSKESACNAGDPGLIPGLGRSLGEGNGNSIQYSCLENSMDRGDWETPSPRGCKSWTWLSD